MFARLFRRNRDSEAARVLYEAAVRQGRDPAFYRELAVPDTLDGRFESICLQVWLLLRRLRMGGAPVESLAQELTEVFFADMDLSLREIGAADIGVGRRVKRMIEGFYGRVKAYDEALAAAVAGEGGPLDAALRRNLYGTLEAAPEGARRAVAQYLLAADRALAAQPLEAVAAGQPAFPPPPGGEASGGAAATGDRGAAA